MAIFFILTYHFMCGNTVFRKTEITNLLKGEKVILNANIATASTDKADHPNAEKFTKILLDFKFANKSRQK